MEITANQKNKLKKILTDPALLAKNISIDVNDIYIGINLIKKIDGLYAVYAPTGTIINEFSSKFLAVSWTLFHNNINQKMCDFVFAIERKRSQSILDLTYYTKLYNSTKNPIYDDKAAEASVKIAISENSFDYIKNQMFAILD